MRCRRTRGECFGSRPRAIKRTVPFIALSLFVLGEVLLRGLSLRAVGRVLLEGLARPHGGPERPAGAAAETKRPAVLRRDETFERDVELVQAVERSGLLHGAVHEAAPCYFSFAIRITRRLRRYSARRKLRE